MALSSSRRHFHLRVFCCIWFARALYSGCGVLISLSGSTCACISVNVFLNSSLSSVFVSSSGLSMYLARVLSVTAVSCSVLVCTLDCGFRNEVPLGGNWVGSPLPNLLPCLPVFDVYTAVSSRNLQVPVLGVLPIPCMAVSYGMVPCWYVRDCDCSCGRPPQGRVPFARASCMLRSRFERPRCSWCNQ